MNITVAENHTRPDIDYTASRRRHLLWKRRLIDVIIVTIVGALLLVIAIMWVLPTGTFQDRGWHTLYADPGQKVKFIVYTNDDPVVIYIISVDMLEDFSTHDEVPAENIGMYGIAAHSRETIELQLPEDDNGDETNWGFYLHKPNGSGSIIYRQTRPVVMDHLLYTWVPPASLIVLLVIGLVMNHFLIGVDLRDLDENNKSIE